MERTGATGFLRAVAVVACLACFLPANSWAQVDAIELTLLTPRPVVGEVALVGVTGSVFSPGAIGLTQTSSTNFLLYREGGCVLGTCPPETIERIVTLGPFEEAGTHVVSYVETPFIDPAVELVFDVAASAEDPNAPWRMEPMTINGQSSANDQDPVRLIFTRDTPCEEARLLEARPIRSPADTALVAKVLTWPAPCFEVEDPENPSPATVVEANFGVLPTVGGSVEIPVQLEVVTSADFAAAQATGTEPATTVYPLGDVTVADAPDVAQLLGGRFDVTSTWRDFEDQTGTGRLVTGATDRSALFTFFGVENWEVTAKMLDGCAFNGHYWVFLSAATDVEYVVSVRDGATGAVREYANPLGIASPAVTDTTAFPCN